MTKIIVLDRSIAAKYIIPVDLECTYTINSCTILRDHTIGVLEGKIKCIVPSSEFSASFESKDHRVYEGEHAVIPGLVNCHTHLGMTHFRGLFEDLALYDWLTQLWPVETKMVKEHTEEFLLNGTGLGIYEGLKTGTTTFNDMYFRYDITKKAAEQFGVRYFSGEHILDFKDGAVEQEVKRAEQSIVSSITEKPCDLSRTVALVHGCYTSSEAHQSAIAAAAKQHPTGIVYHTHLHETKSEIESFYTNNTETAIQRLDRLGLLNERLVAAHCVHLTEQEIKLLGTLKVNCVHNPRSNMKLASGICPVKELLNAGANVCLGTDGAATNNTLDMLLEAQTAALLSKVSTGSVSSIDCYQVLCMATRNGAAALGLRDHIGSLEVGKEADLVVLDLQPDAAFIPVINPIAHIVYTMYRKVRRVLVAGEVRVDEYEVTTKMDWKEQERIAKLIEKYADEQYEVSSLLQ